MSPVEAHIRSLVDLETRGWDFPWKGRTCKVYTRLLSGEWKMIFQTGALEYPPTRG